MELLKNFDTIAQVNLNCKEYTDMKSAMLAIDWINNHAIRESNAALAYAPGIRFFDIPLTKEHPVHIKMLNYLTEEPQYQSTQFKKLWETSVPFFTYIESLIPNHRVVKAEIFATPPERYNANEIVKRIHIDNGNFHALCKRCQIAFSTNDQSYLFVENSKQLIEEGVVYEFNNRRCHWGVNWGKTLKLVLVLDIIDLDIWNNLTKEEYDTFFNFPDVSEHIKKVTPFRKNWLLKQLR